jgi:two-component system sensor kinase FixL
MAASDEMAANGPMDVTELRALLDAAVDAIVVIDASGVIATFNAAAERLFGYRAADVIGQPVELLMPEPHCSQHQSYVDRYLETGEARIIGIGREVQGRRANGELFPIALSVGEARDGRGRRFVGIIRDLSSQRAAEQRARALEARLAHVGRFNLMGEMAAGIAHEINQPLSAIATYAQAASRILERDQPGMTKLIEVCRKIDEQARRAGAVIDNLRKFIRQRNVETQPLDVNRTIVDVVNLIGADAHAEGIALNTYLAPDLPKVSADPVQLQQVLLNLTRNSVDAIRSGVRKEPGISIATDRTPRDGVRIAVTDCGPGVAPQLGDDIFHPFVTTKLEGLGVGLAISRTIVQSYGGKLTYRDNPSGGAIFEVDLPPIERHAAQP